jgi:hypothetical protein
MLAHSRRRGQACEVLLGTIRACKPKRSGPGTGECTRYALHTWAPLHTLALPDVCAVVFRSRAMGKALQPPHPLDYPHPRWTV